MNMKIVYCCLLILGLGSSCLSGYLFAIFTQNGNILTIISSALFFIIGAIANIKSLNELL